jgi:hypothetical protein
MDVVVKAIETLAEFAGSARNLNPPEVVLEIRGLSEAHLRLIAHRFGVAVGSYSAGRSIDLYACEPQVAGRRLKLVLAHHREATREELVEQHRKALAQLEGDHG